MFAIIGIVVVFGCIAAGYLMEHGSLRVLIQPAELIIIAGAAAGTLLVANPLHIIKKIAAGVAGGDAPVLARPARDRRRLTAGGPAPGRPARRGGDAVAAGVSCALEES